VDLKIETLRLIELTTPLKVLTFVVKLVKFVFTLVKLEFREFIAQLRAF